MRSMTTTGRFLICWAVIASGLVAASLQSLVVAQSNRASGHEVVFELRTSTTAIGRASDDQLTIVFSNASGELSTPPTPLLGQDVLAEFTVSGFDARPGQVSRIVRFVPDDSFLNARFVRVINHGADGWGGESISLTIDGRTVLSRQSLFPRKGARLDGGIEKYNRLQWRERIYWEQELQRIRRDGARRN